MANDRDALELARRETSGRKPTQALLIDWLALGLVHASSRGRGRGVGRAPREWSDEQAELFAELYRRRFNGEPIRALLDEVIARWIAGDPAISVAQARRALHSWARPERVGSQRVSRQLARELVELAGYAPSAGTQLVPAIAAALVDRRPITWSELEPAAAAAARRPALDWRIDRVEIRRRLRREVEIPLLLDRLPVGRGIHVGPGQEVSDLASETDLAARRDVADRLRHHRPTTPTIPLVLINAVEGIARVEAFRDDLFERLPRRSRVPLPSWTRGACFVVLAELARTSRLLAV